MHGGRCRCGVVRPRLGLHCSVRLRPPPVHACDRWELGDANLFRTSVAARGSPSTAGLQAVRDRNGG